METKVVLPCTVEDKEGLLQWTKDDFGLGTKRDLPGPSVSLRVNTIDDTVTRGTSPAVCEMKFNLR